MDKVNETPSIVDIRRFPQREEELKKTKKKYPQSSESFHEHLIRAFEKMDNEEDNVIDITPKQNKNPPMNISWLYQPLSEER